MKALDRYYAPQRKLFNQPLAKLVPLLVVTILACGAIGYSGTMTPWLVLLLVPVFLLALFNALVTGLSLALKPAPAWENKNALTGFCSLMLSLIIMISTCIGMGLALAQPVTNLMVIGAVASLLFVLLSRVRIVKAPA